jgi:hypothetical protein
MIGNSSGWEGSDMDTPWVVQYDDTMHMYYSACGSCWSQTGLTIIDDIPFALTQAYPPGNYIDTERGSSASLQIMPPVGWEKSITGYDGVGGQNFEITLDPAMTGRAVVMQDANDIVPLELYKDIDSLSSGSVSAWMQTDTTTGEYNMELYGDAQSVTALSVGFDSGGVFHYWNGSHVDTAVSFAVDTWYRIQIDFDVTTNKYAFAVYDTSSVELLKVEDVDFGSSVTTGIDSIHFYTSASFNGHAYLDDIRVIALPDLEPVVSISSELTPDLTESYSTVTKTLTSDIDATIRWKVTASDTSGNTTMSDIYSFTTVKPDLPMWWNTDWSYRVVVSIDAADYNRINEPIEHAISFTQLFDELGQSGLTLDINSVRVAEHDPNGVVIGEANSQFDEDAGFDAATNATGTVVWIMDGTTPSSTTRYYYIYFDSVDNAKSVPAYVTDLDWNNTTKTISNITLDATIGSAGGRSGLSSFQYNGTEYLTNNGMVYIDGVPSIYDVLIDGPVKMTVKLTATVNGDIKVTVYDLAEFVRLEGHITGTNWYFTPFPYLWSLNTGTCTNSLSYYDADAIQSETVVSNGWSGHAPQEGWACYEGVGSNKDFCLVTDSNTLAISNNFWRHNSGGRQLMIPGFNPNIDFPINPVSWIVPTDTYQDGRDFWNKLASPVAASQGAPEAQAVTPTYDLIVSADSKGTVDPNGTVTVNQGDSQLFTATPDTGYEVNTWLVDSNSVQTGGTGYTLGDIQSTHRVSVTFKPILFTISGHILNPAGVALEAVTVTADNGGGVDTTDPNGHYQLTVGYDWTGSVTPAMQEYDFDPNSADYANVQVNQIGDYTGRHITDLFADGVVDGYDLQVLCDNWLAAVLPDMDIQDDGQMDLQDFRILAEHWREGFIHGPVMISGYILNLSEMPMEGVSVTTDNGGGVDTTDLNGHYQLTLEYDWTGTVTPIRQDYDFDPNSINYANVQIEQVDNYSGRHIADLFADCVIDEYDLKILASNWLDDISADSDIHDDGKMNLLDFSILAEHWLEEFCSGSVQ